MHNLFKGKSFGCEKKKWKMRRRIVGNEFKRGKSQSDSQREGNYNSSYCFAFLSYTLQEPEEENEEKR